MPRPRNLFRLENASKDSGLSFHCCGKPDDLLDEPLDIGRRTRKNARPSNSESRTHERPLGSLLVATLRNEHRLLRESRSTEVLSPDTSPTSSSSWSLHSYLFWSTPTSPNSKSGSKIKRFWCKKHEHASMGTDHDPGLGGNPGEGGADQPKQLRSVRSMPLLSGPCKPTSRRSRCRSRCLSPLSFAGLDRLVDGKHEHEKPIRRESGAQRSTLSPSDSDHSAPKDPTSSKPHAGLFPRPSKIYALLSMANWSHYLLNRHPKQETSPTDEAHPTHP